MFPLCRDYRLLVRVFPFNAYETTITIEERFGHENHKDEEPITVLMILRMRQQ